MDELDGTVAGEHASREVIIHHLGHRFDDNLAVRRALKLRFSTASFHQLLEGDIGPGSQRRGEDTWVRHTGILIDQIHLLSGYVNR